MGVQEEVLKRFTTFKSRIRIASNGQTRFTVPSVERDMLNHDGDFRIILTNLDADGIIDQRDKISFRSSITSQGRVTIPKDYAGAFEAEDGDTVQIFMKKAKAPESDSVKSIKQSLGELRGSLNKFDFER